MSTNVSNHRVAVGLLHLVLHVDVINGLDCVAQTTNFIVLRECKSSGFKPTRIVLGITWIQNIYRLVL